LEIAMSTPELADVAEFVTAAAPELTGVFPLLAPRNQVSPYATYGRRGTARSYTLGGPDPSNPTTAVIRVIAWAKNSYAAALALGDLLVAAAHAAGREVADELDLVDLTAEVESETWYGRVVDVVWPYEE
jgi:hypothetical protein